MLQRLVARLILALVIVVTLIATLLGVVLGWFRRASPQPFRVAMIGTFYNDGWLVAHATPLVACESVDEVLVLCDDPLSLELDGLTYVCPSDARKRRWGRHLARVITLLETGMKIRPQIYMGYHIMPNGPLARVAASLFGGAAIYQMTGGPIQVEGGGPGSENPLLAATGKPLWVMEKLMFALVRSFDAVVVRGRFAQRYVQENQLSRYCDIITGAIDTELFRPGDSEPDIDILYVARLIPGKGHRRLMDVVQQLKPRMPDLRIVLAGDGPMEQAFRDYAAARDVLDNFDFIGRSTEIPALLARSRTYLLLSDTEGMSIALLEAMGAGVPVMVTDVGDLSDVVRDDETGVLVSLTLPVEQLAERLGELLASADRREAMGSAGRKLIQEEYSMVATGQKWQRIFAAIH